MIAAMQPFEPGRTLPAKTLDLWFDYTCPFAYLGSTQARALAARMGARLAYKPLLLGGVFRANDTPQKLFDSLSPAKGAHTNMDMQRWAKHFGVPLTMPPGHPIRSVEALRATLACGIDPKVVDGFFRAYWVENAPISDREVVRRVVASAGHAAGAVLAKIDTPEIKDDLRRRTDEAIALGIFGVPSWVVDGEHLYWGQDRMRFVEGVRAERERESESEENDVTGDAGRGMGERRTGKSLEVYWDFSSPFAYLGCTQVEALARRTGARVTYRPLLLGGLFRSIGTPDAPILAFSEAKRRYILKDLDRWAAYWGVPFKYPSRFPMVTVKALRVYLALPDERRGAYRDRVFRAYWAEDRDISDDAVLAECVGDEAAARDALARATTDEVKAELRRATEEAAARGVFGVPTFIVERRDLYWGQDRLDLVEEALATERASEP